MTYRESNGLKSWEVEAEAMKRKNLLARGLLVPPGEKLRLERKAYKLLMRLYESTYWASALRAKGSARGVRAVRQSIRDHCSREARRIIQAAVTLPDHRRAIKQLQLQVLADRAAARVAFKTAQAEREVARAD